MYLSKLVTHSNNKLNYYHITNDIVSCKVFPNLGASLQEFKVGQVNLIDGIINTDDPYENYSVKYPSSILFPFPGRIDKGRYQFEGDEFQFPINEPTRGNALHGFLNNKEFEFHSENFKNDYAEISFIYAHKGNDYYPFPFDFTVTYKIKKDSFEAMFNVLNTGNTKMPFGIGWHPYFKTNNLEQSQINFVANEEVICNDTMIPVKHKEHVLPPSFKIENKEFDTSFVLKDTSVQFKTNEYKLNIGIESNSNHYLQLYTPLDRNSIAIEPMSCLPNAFNNFKGLEELQAGDTFTYKIDVNYELY